MNAKNLLQREAAKARHQLDVYKDGYDEELKELIGEVNRTNDRIRALVASRQSIQPRLEKRVIELDKAVSLTEEGMDPLIAKIMAPVMLEEEAKQASEWDDLFDAVFGDEP